jgi:DNA-binding LacI/PurR family transcriptional regulator/signal transduction histidine kinase/DNA-binding NarL/FixJ family response regulator
VIRLVIVDDNPMVLGGLRALFETTKDFAVVGEGANGGEAIVAARESNADVVLMDLSMPKMDGIEACRRISAESPAVRVIIYGAFGSEQRVAAAMAAGAADYLGKGLPPDELVTRVRSLAMAGATGQPGTPREPARRTETRPPATTVPRSRDGHPRGTRVPPRGDGGAALAPGRENRRAMTDGGVREGLTVGILSSLLAGPYVTDLMAGIAAAADAAGVRLIAVQTLDPGGLWPSEHAMPEVAIRVPSQYLRISWDRVDGFLIVQKSVEPWFLDAMAEAGKPAVVVGDDIDGFRGPTVRADNRTGIMQVVTHLVQHGHRRIAFAGSPDQGDIRERLEAYRVALIANGIEPDDSLVFAAPNNLESGGEVAGRAMLAAGLPSTAVVAGTDFNAIGIMKVLSEAELSLPHDQAIVGFDDVPAGTSMRPTLSTVHQGLQAMGRTALDLLTQALAGREVPSGRHLVPTVFVPRESCGCSHISAVDGLAGDDGWAAATPEERFCRRLERLLAGPDVLSVARRQAFDRAAELTLRLAGRGRNAEPPTGLELREASLALLAVSPHWTAITSVEACLQEYWSELPDDAKLELRASDFERFMRAMVVELSRSLAEMEGHARTALQLSLDAEHDVSTSIIRGGIDHPSSLDWLAFTPARAGCLGLWTDGPVTRARDSRRLRIAGSFPSGGWSVPLPAQVRIEAFPPEALVAQRRPGEIVAVVPVKTTSMDLGVLAMVIPLVGTQVGGRDRLFDKGALLGLALQREITTERLRRSNADLATFSHAMAHDLRNPLATVLMWASVAPSTAGPDDRAEPVLRTVDRIRDVAAYANDLIAHLLRYAELDRSPAPSESVDLELVVSKAVAALESVVRESRAVIQHRDLPAVIADAAGLEVVMENLISNAITYRRDLPPRVVIEASATEDAWEIRCRDNGSGIPEDVREEIFQPFVRGDPAISGTGLGLATCRRIIERLGGRIWVEESTETGTSIAFTLPFAGAAAERDVVGPSPAGPGLV